MIIDTNVNLFRWPFRRVEGDDPASLVTHLRKQGVSQAWAGSYEGMIFRDIGGVNARLAAACQKYGRNFLVPFGCVNPMLPDWREDVRRCHEVHHMPGLRLFPNYNGYTLADPAFAELLGTAVERNLIVQVALNMEDTRTQFPLMRVPPTDPSPLPGLLQRTPNLRLMLLNAEHSGRPRTPVIPAILQAKNVYFDIAMNEGVVGLTRLIAHASPSRVVFGSHYPFYYFESALLKVRGSGLPKDQAAAIYGGNARSLLRQRNARA